MNATVFTAQATASHRAAQLDRENEILRSQAERSQGVRAVQPDLFSTVATWVATRLHITRAFALRAAH